MKDWNSRALGYHQPRRVLFGSIIRGKIEGAAGEEVWRLPEEITDAKRVGYELQSDWITMITVK